MVNPDFPVCCSCTCGLLIAMPSMTLPAATAAIGSRLFVAISIMRFTTLVTLAGLRCSRTANSRSFLRTAIVRTSLGRPFGFPDCPGTHWVNAFFLATRVVTAVVVSLAGRCVLCPCDGPNHSTRHALRSKLRSAATVTEFITLSVERAGFLRISHGLVQRVRDDLSNHTARDRSREDRSKQRREGRSRI